MFSSVKVAQGNPSPLGSSIQFYNGKRGTNFALFSSQAESVELCLFDEKDQESRFPMMHKTDDIWHIWVEGVDIGAKYGFRVSSQTSNAQKLLIDPYAKTVQGKPRYENEADIQPFLLSNLQDNAHLAPKSVVTDDSFNWEGDRPLNTPWAETIIYELHVKGFSQLREDLPEDIRGTYAALADPKLITYLKDLGVSAVELLPVTYYLDELHLQFKGMRNYWGYNPLSMFAVEERYWSGTTVSPLVEFKQMVKALHNAGIEVILDMVFNHSAESEKGHPTYCQRGIDEPYYYWHNAEGNDYLNWTGCGNMLNVSKPHTRRWVIDCLRYWVESCHIDGFRFDLATTLGRETPDYNPYALLFAEIAKEPSLKECKFIAEPWDIGHGGYQVGQFPSYFAEWNDKFRDDMCRFWLWKSGELGAFAQRFSGSSDIFQHSGRKPHHSINFITAHDGFVLRDLTSYNQKHNEKNGENNCDGRNENYSYNHGIEGVDNVPADIEKARFFTAISLLTSLLLSNGTPMLLAGDEFGNTQWGNNNAYCQDNPITWLKWNNYNQELLMLVSQLIALRKKITSLMQDEWWTENNVQWLNAHAQIMKVEDWHNLHSKAMQIKLDDRWLLLINAKAQMETFILPDGDWEVICNQSAVNFKEFSAEMAELGFCVLERKSYFSSKY